MLYTILRLLAGLLTVAAVVAHHFIPKVVVVRPGSEYVSTLYGQERSGGLMSARWINQAHEHFYCEYRESDPYSCGYTVSFSADATRGISLEQYDGIRIKLRHHGDAARLRLHLRNFDDRYDDANDPWASAKFMAVAIRTSDFRESTYVKLSEFSVADWWVWHYDVPREYSAPEFSNVTGFGIDFVAYGENDILIERIELVGSWIRAETLYLMVMVFWLTLILWEGVSKVYGIYRHSKQASRRIDALETDNRKLQNEKQQFEVLSSTDVLTGVLNRAGVQKRFEFLCQQINSGDRYAVFIIDIDNFKRINDRLGHDVGDVVLTEVAALIASTTRESDIFGRWGGEEFVLICPRLSESQAVALGEKIRACVHTHPFTLKDKSLVVSVSLGGALAVADNPFEQALRRADEALYKAKNTGRNCVVMFGSSN